MDKIKRQHSLLIEEGKLNVLGIVRIDSSNDKIIVMQLSDKTLSIFGDSFNIDLLDLEAGKLTASGNVKEAKYSSAHEKQALMKRLFK
ncbi:MAG: hypothetical protein RR357_04340 [Clostridia bacterium]